MIIHTDLKIRSAPSDLAEITWRRLVRMRYWLDFRTMVHLRTSTFVEAALLKTAVHIKCNVLYSRRGNICSTIAVFKQIDDQTKGYLLGY